MNEQSGCSGCIVSIIVFVTALGLINAAYAWATGSPLGEVGLASFLALSFSLAIAGVASFLTYYDERDPSKMDSGGCVGISLLLLSFGALFAGLSHAIAATLGIDEDRANQITLGLVVAAVLTIVGLFAWRRSVGNQRATVEAERSRPKREPFRLAYSLWRSEDGDYYLSADMPGPGEPSELDVPDGSEHVGTIMARSYEDARDRTFRAFDLDQKPKPPGLADDDLA